MLLLTEQLIPLDALEMTPASLFKKKKEYFPIRTH